jgi:hypothetical protein
MEWYYSRECTSHGPVTASDLRELHREGAIADDTLVWCDALADWSRWDACTHLLNDSAPHSSDPDLAGAVSEPLAVCAWSGQVFPESELLRYGDQWVAPQYKDLFVQRLREGDLPPAEVGGLLDPEERVTDLSLITILVQSYKLWRANALAIVVVTTAIWLPINLFVEYRSYTATETEEEQEWSEIARDMGKAFRDQQKFDTWFGILALGSVIFAVNRTWNGDRPVTLGEAFRAAFQHWPRMFGTRFLYGLFLLLLFIPGIGLIAVGDPIAITVGVIYLVIALAIYMVRHAFCEVIAVSDGHGGTHALERTREITRGHFWRVFGYQVLVYATLTGGVILLGLILLFPALDNFVVSAIHSVSADLIMTFGVVETYVLFRHLEGHPR